MSNFDALMALDNNEEASVSSPITPLFTLDRDPVEVKKWCLNAFNLLMKKNKNYFEEIRDNLRLYKGNVYETNKSSVRPQNDSDPHLEKARNTKLYVNRIRDLVEFRVSTHNAAKPGIDIGPANVEYEDRIGAQMAKAVVDSVWYQQDEDEVERTTIRYAVIAGEHYVGTLWDPEKGDIHPSYREWQKQVQSKKNGEVIDISPELEGMKYNKNKPVKTGDIVYKHFPAWQVLPEPVDSWDKLTYLITWEYEYVDTLKKMHPSKAELISPLADSAHFEGFDPQLTSKLRNEGKTIVLTVWGKRCSYMEEGRFIKLTCDGTILVDKEMPYDQDELPLTRLTDMDEPGELRGRSFLRDVRGLQHQHYFLTSMSAANLRLMGYPKWVIEQGSVQIKDLANTRNVLQFRAGASQPFILQPNPTPPEVYKQIQDLEIKMDTQVKGAFSNPSAIPKRTDSAAAFEYLDNKDSQRSHTMFSKVNKFRVELTKQTIYRAGQFYTQDDNRLIRIVGKNHEYDLRHFKAENFARPYDVRIKEGSALPDEKGARMKAIVDLVERLPEGTFSSQQILDLLDLSSVDKLFDIGTKSLRAAESIIQDLLMGNPVPPPEGFEDLMTYWQTFGTYIQDRQFKESVPPEMKGNVLDYLNAIEALMFDKADKNPAFAQRLATLELYPLVFVLPPPIPEMPPEQAVAAEAVPAPEMSPEEQMMMQQQQQGELINGVSDLMRSTAAGDALEQP